MTSQVAVNPGPRRIEALRGAYRRRDGQSIGRGVSGSMQRGLCRPGWSSTQRLISDGRGRARPTSAARSIVSVIALGTYPNGVDRYGFRRMDRPSFFWPHDFMRRLASISASS